MPEKNAKSRKIVEPELKNGTLPAPVIKLPECVTEPFESDWNIELLIEDHPEFDGKVFIAKMTSKWGGTKPIYFLCSDLFDKKKQQELTKELVNRGRFRPDEIEALIDYIDHMKVSGPGMITPDDGGYKQHIMETADFMDEDVADKCYKAIVEHYVCNDSVFPSRSKGGYTREHHGAVLDDEGSLKKYGDNAVAIVPEHLRNIVGIPNTKKLNAVLKELAKKGVFHPGSSENRQSVTLKAGYATHCYVFAVNPSVLSEGRVDIV